MNIGNQASQLFSIFYPTRIDNYIRIVKGYHWHGRYMDDTVVLSDSKEDLHALVSEIQPICDDMGLFINEKKTQVSRVDNDFKYLNRIYRVTSTGHICERLSRDTILRQERKIRKAQDSGRDIYEQYLAWCGNYGRLLTPTQRAKIECLYGVVCDHDERR